MVNCAEVLACNTDVKPLHHEGAFDCFRLVAAAVVLFSHCYPLLGKGYTDPLAHVLTGTFAVYVFFAISGYLVTQSWFRDPSVSRFMLRRGLRIFPALMFVIVASVFVIGSLTTNLSLTDYFSRRETWSHLAKILIFPTQHGLPGVFDDNPFPNVVNGSLWTLRLEFGLYAIVAALGQYGILRFKGTGATLAVGCLAAYVLLSQTFPVHRQILVFFANTTPFFVGMSLAQHNIDSKMVRISTLALLLLTVLLTGTDAFPFLLLLSLPCTVLFLAHNINCPLGKKGDYSYGLYLWGFPVEQTLLHFSGPISVTQLFLRATMITLLIAVVSWHLVEKRALRLKPSKNR